MEFRFVIIDGKIYNDNVCHPLPTEICKMLINMALANTDFNLEEFNDPFMDVIADKIHPYKPDNSERICFYEEVSTGRIKIGTPLEETDDLSHIFSTNAPAGRLADLHEHLKSKALGDGWFSLTEDEVGDAIAYKSHEGYFEWRDEKYNKLGEYLKTNPKLDTNHVALLDQMIERRITHMLDVELSYLEEESDDV